MKKIFIVLAVLTAVSAVFFAGCKSIPTDDQMYVTSYSIGVSASLVANQTKIDDVTRGKIVEIANIIDQTVPQTNQTFEAAWLPLVKRYVDSLVANKVVDRGQGDIIVAAFVVAAKGADYIVTVRYPKARMYQGLVEAATHGFCAGFLTHFKPANSFSSGAVGYDKAAYEYLSGACR